MDRENTFDSSSPPTPISHIYLAKASVQLETSKHSSPQSGPIFICLYSIKGYFGEILFQNISAVIFQLC